MRALAPDLLTSIRIANKPITEDELAERVGVSVEDIEDCREELEAHPSVVCRDVRGTSVYFIHHPKRWGGRLSGIADAAERLEAIEDELTSVDGMEDFRNRLSQIRMDLVDSALRASREGENND